MEGKKRKKSHAEWIEDDGENLRIQFVATAKNKQFKSNRIDLYVIQ